MEIPTEFFLDFAWNPEALSVEKLASYTEKWAVQYFGEQHAAEIARMIDGYTRFNSRRKPELLDASTYSLFLQDYLPKRLVEVLLSRRNHSEAGEDLGGNRLAHSTYGGKLCNFQHQQYKH